MARIVTRLSDEDMLQVKAFCKKNKTTQSAVVRAAFELKPAKRGRPAAKKKRKRKE